MAFCLQLPFISDTIGGETVYMTAGGVWKYDGSSLRTGADQHFKLFAGYQVKVCCNLCGWTDGMLSNVRVNTLGQLKDAIYHLLCKYDAIQQLERMEVMLRYFLSEAQFAHFIGKAMMYQYLHINRVSN